MTKHQIWGFAGIATALACMCSPVAAGANLKLQPGEYVVTTTYEVQDQRQNEPRIAIRCLAPQDMGDPEGIFNDESGSAPENGKRCSVRNLKDANRELSYEADCANRTVHVEGSLSDEGFSVVRIVTPKGNQGVSLKGIVRGRRIGGCSVHAGD